MIHEDTCIVIPFGARMPTTLWDRSAKWGMKHVDGDTVTGIIVGCRYGVRLKIRLAVGAFLLAILTCRTNWIFVWSDGDKFFWKETKARELLDLLETDVSRSLMPLEKLSLRVSQRVTKRTVTD